MRVRIEQDDQLTTPEVVLRVPSRTSQTAELVAALQAAVTPQQLRLSQRGQHVSVPLTTILFCEAAGHQVTVHTADQMYTTREPLYKLAEQLPGQFVRASKSAILNSNQVASLTKSLTGNLVKFQQSHKQLYVSRRYYGDLKRVLERKGKLG
ncbi:LytR family transcriptional regulator [Levilactobacillus acidifarinae]|nr:LytR family transcriptional regulator [Levilactobacillus acidifarinae]